MAATLTTISTLTRTQQYQFAASTAQTGPGSAKNVAGSRQINQTSYSLGTGTGAANQVMIGLISIAGGATSNFLLNASTQLNCIDGTATPTLSKIKYMCIELLSATQTDQDGNAGTAASSITLGDHATNAWAGILGATGTYTISNGGKWTAEDDAGISVTVGDILKTVNNDGAITAKVMVSIIGVA